MPQNGTNKTDVKGNRELKSASCFQQNGGRGAAFKTEGVNYTLRKSLMNLKAKLKNKKEK